MDSREKKQMDIFTILISNISRDNKNNYCEDHAMERAKVIENSLFTNCCKQDNENWKELYNSVDLVLLVDKVELKTTKCKYL